MAVFLFCAALAHAQQRPAFSITSGAVTVSLPPRILDDPAIRKQLSSGLTTSFVALARARNTPASAARMTVRYDLWDEVWIVTRTDFDGRADSQRLASFEALQRWWHNPLRVSAAGADRPRGELTLSVLPFSAEEEKDARDWISKSGGVGTAAPGSAGTFLDALIGTTISARPITTYRWSIDLPPR